MARPTAVVPSRYLDELLRSAVGRRLIEARVFPNAKEVTESFGARRAVRPFADAFPPDDPDTVLVAVGDGTTPRTAATFALTTNWDCHSVDPRLRTKARWSTIDRLTLHRRQIEEVQLRGERVVVVLVHAHVAAATALSSVAAESVLLVSMPCCVAPGIDEVPELRYRDPWVGSVENELLVWRYSSLPGWSYWI